MQKRAIPLLPLSTTDNIVAVLQERFGNRVTPVAARSSAA